jgi:hypothetical protein
LNPEGRFMATKAQVAANRRNAEKSTGPRTAEGKEVVAQNAVKHGLSGRVDVIKGEDQEQFERHREALLAELKPQGVVETLLAERAVGLSWRLKRVERMQNEVFEVQLAEQATPSARRLRSTTPGPAEDDGLDLGRAVIKDFTNYRVLDRLMMYERRMENSLLKTFNDLHLRRLRIREYISRHMDEIGNEPVRSVPVRASSPWGEDGGAGGEGPASGADLPVFPFEETPDGVTTNTPGVLPHHSSIPSFQYSTAGPDGAARAEPSCKTKPISWGTNDGQVPAGEEVRVNPAEHACEETNPIWAGLGAEVDPASATAEKSPIYEGMGR